MKNELIQQLDDLRKIEIEKICIGVIILNGYDLLIHSLLYRTLYDVNR